MTKMGLLDKSQSPASTPAFETDAGDVAMAADNPETGANTATVPAVKASGTVAAFNPGDNPISLLKNALTVDYNTLAQIKATQGNLMERETNANMGDWLIADIMSWQDSFVVSPGDDKAPKELVKYSNDGTTCNDGTSVADALADLRSAGWLKAKLNQRAVVVLAVYSTAKDSDKFAGTLMQLDLAPTSRTQWQRYCANTAFGLKLGKLKPEQVTKVKLTTRIAMNGTNAYTVVDFSVAD